MKPINFKEQNAVFAKDQKEYLPLPVYKENSEKGEVVSCWKPTFIERINILFGGKIWLCLLTFNTPLQPIILSARKDEIFINVKKEQRLLKFWNAVKMIYGC